MDTTVSKIKKATGSRHATLKKRPGHKEALSKFVEIMKVNKLFLDDLCAAEPWIGEYLSAYRNLPRVWQKRANKEYRSIVKLGVTNSTLYRMREDITPEMLENFSSSQECVAGQHIIKIDPDKILRLPITADMRMTYKGESYSCCQYVEIMRKDVKREIITPLWYEYYNEDGDLSKTKKTSLLYFRINDDHTEIKVPTSIALLMRDKVVKQPKQEKLNLNPA